MSPSLRHWAGGRLPAAQEAALRILLPLLAVPPLPRPSCPSRLLSVPPSPRPLFLSLPLSAPLIFRFLLPALFVPLQEGRGVIGSCPWWPQAQDWFHAKLWLPQRPLATLYTWIFSPLKHLHEHSREGGTIAVSPFVPVTSLIPAKKIGLFQHQS